MRQNPFKLIPISGMVDTDSILANNKIKNKKKTQQNKYYNMHM